MDASPSKNIYIEKLRQEILTFMAADEVKIYLFGSWARGEERHGSDVDIAIDGAGEGLRSKIAALREHLAESTIPYRVDIVDMRRVSDTLRREIRKDGILWQR